MNEKYAKIRIKGLAINIKGNKNKQYKLIINIYKGAVAACSNFSSSVILANIQTKGQINNINGEHIKEPKNNIHKSFSLIPIFLFR